MSPLNFQTKLFSGNQKAIKLIGLAIVAALFFVGVIWGVGRMIKKSGGVVEQRCERGAKCIGTENQQSNNTQTVGQGVSEGSVSSSSQPKTQEEILQSLTLNASNTKVSEFESKAAKSGELAEGFPRDIPINDSLNILESNSLKNVKTGNITEAKTKYQSKKNFDDNKKVYEQWAESNGWKKIPSNPGLLNSNNITLSFSKENKYVDISLEKLLYDTTSVIIIYKVISF